MFYGYYCTDISNLNLKINMKNRNLQKQSEINKSDTYEAFCFLNADGAVYDLNTLYNPNTDYSISDGKYTVYFNFCKKAHNQCNNKPALALIKSNSDNNICVSLGGQSSSISKWKLVCKIFTLKFFLK
jgi:hypothetical protein